ncbi:MAG: hypothetical protein STSR0003_27100 [Smithella sp.]
MFELNRDSLCTRACPGMCFTIPGSANAAGLASIPDKEIKVILLHLEQQNELIMEILKKIEGSRKK